MKNTMLQFIGVTLILLFNNYSVTFSISLSGETVNADNMPSSCKKNEIFHTIQMKCVKCNSELNLVPSADRVSCTCNDRSRIAKWNHFEYPICEKCGKNEVPTYDQRACITCPQENLIISGNKTLCNNFLCPLDSRSVERHENGSLMSRIKCVKCSNGTQPSANGETCLPCIKSESCSCLDDEEDLGDTCSPKVDLQDWPDNSEAATINYLNGQKIVSKYLKNYLRRNIFLCKKNNVTACQIVGNMCVMLLYEEKKFSPCLLFKDFKRIPTTSSLPLTPPLPWLFYADGDAPSVLSRRRITSSFSISSSSQDQYFNITAAIYTPEGSFLGVKPIKGHDLQLCPESWHSLDKAFRFLYSYDHKCQISAQQLLKSNQTQLMDLYLVYQDGSEYIYNALPILIRNIPPKPFENMNQDRQQWQLVRRFFLLDLLTGVPLGESEPKVVRYAAQMKVQVSLQGKEEQGKIYVPYLEITYDEITKESITRDELIELRFQVEYQMPNKMSRTIEVSMGVMSSLALIWSAIRTWSHTKRCGRVGIDLLTIGHLILFTCGNLANAFFLVVLSICLDNFIFFKGQSVAHVLLPTANQENVLKIYIASAFSLKVVELAHLIYRQMSIDIFLIDWERPKMSAQSDEKGERETVSVWRTYFVANEWNEIQTMRKINLCIHIMSTIFFLEVIGLKYWASSHPKLSLSEDHEFLMAGHSFTCKFAVGALTYILLYLFQFSIITVMYERYIKNGIHEFIDICSLANISVFILALDNYGFYIHGRSAHGFADTDMQTIIEQLQREEDDLVGHRGLLPGSDHQTFEMRLPNQLREYYTRITKPIYATSNIKWQAGKGLRGKMGTENLQRSVQAYHTMNRFLGAFLDHALKDLDYEIRDKVFVESLLGIEFNDPVDKGVFYKDNGHSFDQVLFYGNEFTFASFDLMLFSTVLTFSDNFLLSGIVTVFVNFLISKVCVYGGQRNLAKKTLTDDRFFI